MNLLHLLASGAAEAVAEHGGHAAEGAHAAAEGAHHAAATFPTTPLHGTEFPLIAAVALLPLLGAFINLLIGSRLQKMGLKKVASGIAIGVMVAAAGLGWFVILPKLVSLPADERLLTAHLWTMFEAGSFSADFAFAVDPLSLMMLLIITTVGSGIHIYSVGYMAKDPLYWKFFLYLNYFVFSMLLLVLGDNFMLMFFGWEGVGLASYLLIGFWHEDIEKAKAAMKAFVVNRFGDFGFILGLFALFWALGGNFVGADWGPRAGEGALRYSEAANTVEITDHAGETHAVKVGPTINFTELRNQVVIQETGVADKLKSMSIFGLPLLFFVCVAFFIGATGKSAQIPLFVWLPDAMAGPTPVSALIHAATMVTAGVYMIARLNFLYALSPGALAVVASIGALTALFAATIGLFQHDIKRVLAYSTVSQLGYMFIGVGIGAFWAGAFHLLTHACFKACLFLGSGSVIEGCHHNQDMRLMGGLRKYMPITHWTYLVACLAITGAFPFAAFFSKDEILWLALNTENLAVIPGWAIWALGLTGAAGTSYYMWRSYFFTFWGEYRGDMGHGHDDHGDDHGDDHADDHGDDHGHHGGVPHESPWSMTGVLIFLATASALVGFLLFIPHSWGIHAPFALDEWLAPVMAGSAPLMKFHALGDAHAIEFFLQAFGGMALPALGAMLAWALYVGPLKDLTEQLAQGKDVVIGGFTAKAAQYQPVYQLILEKYRVDELYDMTVIQPSVMVARFLSWFDANVIDRTVNIVGTVVRIACEIMGGVDRYAVDGSVVGVAKGIFRAGVGLKHVQARTVHTYLYTVLGGALAIVIVNYVLF